MFAEDEREEKAVRVRMARVEEHFFAMFEVFCVIAKRKQSSNGHDNEI